MHVKSTWIAAALIGVVGFTPVKADAQIFQSQRVDARARGTIFDRDIDTRHKRSCAHLSKTEKVRCKELRKEEHRLSKLEKKRQRKGTSSVRDRAQDVIYGADVRRPRGTDSALERIRRLPRSGL